MVNKGISRWGFMIAAMAMMTIFIQPTWSADEPEPVGPITSAPTNTFRPGKVVWVDLVTSDIPKAANFYRDVFGWDINISRDGSFAQASYQGSPVSSIALFNKNEAPDGEARWLVSISVSDVDEAAKAVQTNGGKVLEGPTDLPDRGRYVLVEDSRGALLMLLKDSGGDPEDETAVDNTWLWAELWTDDPAKAVGFYHSVIGYKSVSVKDSSGDEILVLGRDQKVRATVVKLPWEEVEPNWLPYMQVASVLETAKSVLEHGGEVVIAPMIDDDGSKIAVVADNTGGVFAIKQRGSE
jgi:predicted enzyme related to lactoylglutathione lyase